MPVSLDTQSIIEETNQALIRETQIDPSDPIVANVILNQVILSRYVETLNQTLEKQHQTLLKALKTEEDSARQIASKVISQSTGYIVEQLQGIQALPETQKTDWLTANSTSRWAAHWQLAIGLVAGIAIGLLL